MVLISMFVVVVVSKKEVQWVQAKAGYSVEHSWPICG